MLVGIISDTHGDAAAIERVAAHPAAQRAAVWLHAGDVAPDAGYLEKLLSKKVYAVAGNCDWPNPNVKDECVLTLAGHKIFLTHGHSYGVRYTTGLFRDAALAVGADIAVYGHTHVVERSIGVLTVLNPGSAARPRDGAEGSFMVAELIEGELPKVEVIRFSSAEK